MKTQKEIATLSLNKNSIIELNDRDISNIHGGSSDIIESIIRATTYGTWLDFL